MNNFALYNGEFIDYNDFSIHVSDLAIQRGFGIFDFFKVVQGKPIFLDRHLARFKNSAKEMGLTIPFSDEVLVHQIMTLLEKNNLPFSGVKIVLTGGYSKDSFSLGEPNLLIIQQTFKINKEAQVNGIKLMSVLHQRQLPHIKTIDYLMAIKTLPAMQANGAQDILYYNAESVTECPRANFFIINAKGEIRTPEKNILSGISRQKILELSKIGYTVTVGDIRLEEIYKAKECFISSTTKNILPVIGIDDCVFGDGKPGPITSMLVQEFDSLIENAIQNS